MNFTNDLKNELRNRYSEIGPPLTPPITECDDLDLLLKYNFRLVQPIPRLVHQSQEFQTKLNSLSPNELGAMQAIIVKIQNGDNINPHLSTGIERINSCDYLLYDWNIYHLHISNARTTHPYYFDRVDNLAFAVVIRGSVYLVDIQPHGKFVFENIDMLRIIKRNWREILEPYRAVGAIGVEFAPQQSEIRPLRKASVSTMLNIDGDIYAPFGGGLTTSGESVSEIRQMIQYKKFISRSETSLNAAETRREVARQLGIDETVMDFRLILRGLAPIIQETSSNNIIGFNP